MLAYERFTVATDEAVGEPGDLPAVFGGNDTKLSAADLARLGDLLAEQDNPLAAEYAGQGYRLVEVEDEPTIPVSISAYQAVRENIERDIDMAAQQALVDGSGDEELQAYFAKETVFRRDSTNIEKLRLLQGRTPEEQDQFFIDASAW